MEHEPQNKNYIAAKLEAQAAMKSAELNATNPHFRNKYANLESITKAIIPVLNSVGIVVTQATEYSKSDDQPHLFRLVTRLTHTSGEFEESSYPLRIDDPQKMGSQITYARRYSLVSMVALAAGDDDDGEIATHAPITTRQAERLKGMIMDNDLNIEAFYKRFNIKKVEDLPASQYNSALGAIKKRLAARADT